MTRRSPTPESLQLIRSLRIAVLHPADQDRIELLEHLKRIGCHVHTCWPDLDVEVAAIDLVIMAVTPQTLSYPHAWLHADDVPPIIPVITYENPVVIEAVMQLNAFGFIPSPVRSSGVLTAIALTIAQHRKRHALQSLIQRSEQKAARQRTIELAKSIIMKTRQLSGDEAYRALCSRARDDRTLIETIADEVVRTGSLRH